MLYKKKIKLLYKTQKIVLTSNSTFLLKIPKLWQHCAYTYPGNKQLEFSSSCPFKKGKVVKKKKKGKGWDSSLPQSLLLPIALQCWGWNPNTLIIWVTVFLPAEPYFSVPTSLSKMGKLERRLFGIWKINLSTVSCKERLLNSPWHLVTWTYPFEL